MRTAWPWSATLLAIALGGAAASSARADCPALQQAQQAYADLDYDRVTPLLEQALGQTCSDEDRAGTYELLAVMHVTYNRDDDAVAAFARLLDLQPDFSLPADRSPKLLQALEQARRAAPPLPATEPPADAARSDDATTTADTPPPEPTPGSAAATTTGEEASADGFGGWAWAGAGTAVGAGVLIAAGVLTWILLQPASPDVDYGPFPL